MKRLSHILGWLFLVALSFPVQAAEVITEIRVLGNEKTKDVVIVSLSTLEVGEEITDKIVRDARDRIRSSGLFETVEIEKARASSRNPDLVILTIRVKEKMSWFVAPTLQFSEDALSGGIVGGESNLFGYNKKALVFADYGPSARRFVLAYRDPAILGSNFTLGLDSLFRWDRMIEYEDRQEIRRVRIKEYGATFLPGYRWSPRFTSSMGFYYRKVDQFLKSESQPIGRPVDTGDDGADVAIIVRFEYNNTKFVDGLMSGAKISVDSWLSDNRFYSTFDYAKQEIRFSSGVIFGGKKYNWQNHMTIQLGQNLPYYREYTSGGSNLRGYIARQFRGDTKYGVGEEFYFPIHEFSRLIVRGTVFYNMNVIYFKDNKFSRDAWKNGVGGGLRLYLKGVVVPLIGFDAAWGIEDKDYSTYLAVGATY